jgi:hypothetical protein
MELRALLDRSRRPGRLAVEAARADRQRCRHGSLPRGESILPEPAPRHAPPGRGTGMRLLSPMTREEPGRARDSVRMGSVLLFAPTVARVGIGKDMVLVAFGITFGGPHPRETLAHP